MKMAENDHESTLLSQTTPHFPAQLGSRDLPLLPLQTMADSTVYSSLQLLLFVYFCENRHRSA